MIILKTIDLLRLPVWSAKLLKSWSIIGSLFILILIRTSLDLKETTALINVYMYLKRLSTLIVFLMVVSSLVFLDTSKAFDRVNHSILFGKLSNRGIPQYVIRVVSYWYENQQMCVCWGGTYSTFFCVTNGVREGSILSPYLFNIYVDDLSVALRVLMLAE